MNATSFAKSESWNNVFFFTYALKVRSVNHFHVFTETGVKASFRWPRPAYITEGGKVHSLGSNAADIVFEVEDEIVKKMKSVFNGPKLYFIPVVDHTFGKSHNEFLSDVYVHESLIKGGITEVASRKIDHGTSLHLERAWKLGNHDAYFASTERLPDSDANVWNRAITDMLNSDRFKHLNLTHRHADDVLALAEEITRIRT